MASPWIDMALAAGGVFAGLSAVMRAMARHKKQLAFFSNPAKAKAIIGGRQSGKTYGVALWLVECWDRYPGATSAYITKTAKAASRRCWPLLIKICKEFKIRVKLNHQDLLMTFSNGYSIWCTGCKDKNECDKIRGEANGFQRIAVDEPATFTDELLEYLLTEAVDPTLMQTMGDLVLSGTPGPIPAGFWYDICHKMGWHVATFTCLDNPHLPDPQGYIDELLRKYGYTLSTPKVMREIFAQWVLDTEALVYIQSMAIFVERNGYHDLPTTRPFDFVTLGIDFGYEPDPCAFAIAGSWWNRRDIWIPVSYTRERLTPDLITQEARKLRKEWSVNRIIVDAGGGGKTTAKAMELSYGVTVEATPKGEKRPKIDTMRGGLNSGAIRVHLIGAQELVAEYQTILWNEDKSKHHELCSDHNADAAIQACMPHRQYALDFELPEPTDPRISDDKMRAYEEAQGDGYQ